MRLKNNTNFLDMFFLSGRIAFQLSGWRRSDLRQNGCGKPGIDNRLCQLRLGRDEGLTAGITNSVGKTGSTSRFQRSGLGPLKQEAPASANLMISDRSSNFALEEDQWIHLDNGIKFRFLIRPAGTDAVFAFDDR